MCSTHCIGRGRDRRCCYFHLIHEKCELIKTHNNKISNSRSNRKNANNWDEQRADIDSNSDQKGNENRDTFSSTVRTRMYRIIERIESERVHSARNARQLTISKN